MGIFTLGANNLTYAEVSAQNVELLAQNEPAGETSGSTSAMDDGTSTTVDALHQSVLNKFIDGGPGFMAMVLICLILGLALCIERIIYLNMATTNTNKLLQKINNALDKGELKLLKRLQETLVDR